MSKSRRKIKHIIYGSKEYLKYLHKRLYKEYGKKTKLDVNLRI